jgi:altronate dehydratase
MKCIQINKDDNVAIAVCDLAAAEEISLEAITVVVQEPVPAYHKVSIETIESGAEVIRYGVPIGKATQRIAPGYHVHLQNMQSSYLPTYLRTDK